MSVPKKVQARAARIVKAVRAGSSYAEVGLVEKLTRQRVFQIYQKCVRALAAGETTPDAPFPEPRPSGRKRALS